MATAPLRMRAYYLPNGDPGVVRTVNRMESLVAGQEGVGSPIVYETVKKAVRGSVRGLTEIDAWYKWVKANIEFRGEPEETLQSPEVTLKFLSGDCDDHSMLLAAGARILGYNTAFKVVATPESEGEFAHVFALVEDPKTHKWLGLDSTVPEAYLGWEPTETTRERTFMAYAAGNFRPGQSVIPRQARMGDWYKPGNFRGLGRLGDDSSGGSGIDYNALLAQTLQEVPAIIGVSSGVATSTSTAAGSSSTGSNIIPAGYGLTATATASPIFWIGGFLLFAGILYAMSKR